MKNITYMPSRQKGLTLIELMVAMAISLVIVIAAAYVYLGSRESQRAIDRSSNSQETGAFVLQMIGREVMNAGFYPAIVAPIPVDPTQQGMYDTYPPLPATPRVDTDWQDPDNNWPPVAFRSAIYGCAGGKFDVATSTCPAVDPAKPDTLVINAFTSGRGWRPKQCRAQEKHRRCSAHQPSYGNQPRTASAASGICF